MSHHQQGKAISFQLSARNFVLRRWSLVVGLLWLLASVVLATACQSAVLEPPRRATEAARQEAAPTTTPVPLISEAPTPTIGPASLDAIATAASQVSSSPAITVWINETSPSHTELMKQMAEDFNTQHGVHAEVVHVNPRLLPELMRTAVISNTLPDLVLHPVEYTMGWLQQGILDADAATAVVDQLGRATFEPNALEMVEVSGTEAELAKVAAVPSDGWQQVLVYRADWLTERGLARPDNYDAMIAAASTVFQPEALISGLVIPTESSLISTQQAFEHIALANGCHLADSKGEIVILHPACLAALDFYREIVNEYSPIGVQTDLSALNAYLAGRTGMIMGSPSVLPRLAGLDSEAQPSCAECTTPDYLARNSGIVTEIRGNSEFATTATFAELHYLGITRTANREAAIAFAHYWLSEGYLDWLAVNPERKIPLRLGTAEAPTDFIDAWANLTLTEGGPTLRDLYGETTVSQLSRGVATSQRWGFAQGQGALVTTMYEELVMSILLQEMLSGYFTSSQAVIEAYKRIIALIPNYAYTIELEATATPTN